MERLVRVKALTEPIKTDVPREQCLACSMIFGEMNVAVAVARMEDPLGVEDMKAVIECHGLGKGNRRHMDITLYIGGEERHAADLVRNWAKRIVHCPIK